MLAHGAGSGPWVYDAWPSFFGGWRVETVDLQAGLEVAQASMTDYAGAVERAAVDGRRPLVLCGWSLGGLAVLMAAQRERADLVWMLEPSPPGEIQGFDLEVPLVSGTYDPEATYGTFPEGVSSRPESMLARAERKRGISVPVLSCPSVVVYGKEFPDVRGRAISALYGSEAMEFMDLDHWSLVLDPRIPEALASRVPRPRSRPRA